MSMRYEGNVIIKGSQEVVEVFIPILKKAHETMGYEDEFEYNNKTYDFSSEEEYDYDGSHVYPFDFPNSGSNVHDSLIEFLEDASRELEGLSFDVITLYEYGSDYDVLTICEGKAQRNKVLMKLMKKAFKSFDWDTQGIPDFIRYLTNLIQNQPTYTNK